MDKRSYESPMDWEYQNTAPMDPSSPFAQSTKKAQANKNIFGDSSSFNTFGQNNSFGRSQSTSSKPPSSIPQTPSIFSSARILAQRTTTAPPFRNSAFTTPRKPFDLDALSEISAAESSPAAATDDGSDFHETPDHDQSYDMGQMTITPATMSRHKSIFSKKASGRGEIFKPSREPSRDKVRKRKRYNGDVDVSGYRLPYVQLGDGDETDYESDDSTFQPSKAQKKQKKRNRDGWIGSFLSTLQRHPYAPKILGYWLNLLFSVVCVSGTLWVGYTIVVGLHQDFNAARSLVREEVLEEIAQCSSHYIDNRCSPKEARLPGLKEPCEMWFACMNKNPDHLKKVQLGAKNIVEIINEIVDTMSYKTIAILLLLFIVFLFSGRSIYKSAHDFPDFTSHASAGYSQPPPHPSAHAGPQQIYWQALQPQTPRHYNARHLTANDETPDTDASPPRFRALMPPETPRTGRSPSKTERGRSPTKSRSPTKRY